MSHERFGEGVIVDIEGSGDKAEAIVRFRDVGEKRLLLVWAPLTARLSRARTGRAASASVAAVLGVGRAEVDDHGVDAVDVWMLTRVLRERRRRERGPPQSQWSSRQLQRAARRLDRLVGDDVAVVEREPEAAVTAAGLEVRAGVERVAHVGGEADVELCRTRCPCCPGSSRAPRPR